jgi:hypothetical protein
MGALAARRGGERGREGEMEESGGERERRREEGWETGCLQLSPASVGPTRTYVEREQIDGCTSPFHQVSCLFSFVGSCVPCWRR